MSVCQGQYLFYRYIKKWCISSPHCSISLKLHSKGGRWKAGRFSCKKLNMTSFRGGAAIFTEIMQRCCLVYTSVLLQKKCTDGAHFDLNPRVNLQVLLTNSPLEQLHNSASQWAGSWAQSFPASWLCRNQIVLRSILATVSSYVQVISPSAFLDRSCPTNLATRQRFRHAHKVKKNKNLCCRYKEGASSHWVIRKGEEHMVAGVNCMEIPCPSTENTLLHMHQATQKCKTKIASREAVTSFMMSKSKPPTVQWIYIRFALSV